MSVLDKIRWIVFLAPAIILTVMGFNFGQFWISLLDAVLTVAALAVLMHVFGTLGRKVAEQ
jgi:uncharacterized membrane protein YdjX (TVP38/TMEM64 family)